MKKLGFRLRDISKRTFRCIYRRLPEGFILVLIDLKGYRRGEIWCWGCENYRDYIEIRCKGDQATEKRLIEFSWPQTKRGSSRYYTTHEWHKGELHLMLMPRRHFGDTQWKEIKRTRCPTSAKPTK
jgi:hypothetical protein